MLSPQAQQAIDREIAKYPPERKQSAVMAALTIGQKELGWVSRELIEHVAGLLELEPIQVAEVATFYSMYALRPVGRHRINVCTNISCMLRGSDDIVAFLKQRLGIEVGEITEDGRFSLHEVECLAACGGAPMAQIGDDYYEDLTPERLDQILAELK